MVSVLGPQNYEKYEKLKSMKKILIKKKNASLEIKKTRSVLSQKEKCELENMKNQFESKTA